MAVDPVCDSGSSGSIGNGNLNRAVQEFLGIKYIIDFLIFQKSVGMDTSSCYIEVLSNERSSFRYVVANLFLIVLSKLCDNRCNGTCCGENLLPV